MLTNFLLLAAAATLVMGLARRRRLSLIIGWGFASAAALVFVHGRLSTPVAQATVSTAEIAHARAAYFKRVIATLSKQRVVRHRTREQNVAWFREARLGLFVHYGPTSLLEAPTDEAWWHAVAAGKFDTAARRFRPAPQVVKGWVSLARHIGASYVTVTAKHHDGFALWDSKLTKWDVGPGHDLLAPLAREAHRRSIPLFFYYSLLDLHEPTYATDKDAYLVFVEGQIRELLTQYGPVAGVWLDGWNRDFGERRLAVIYALVHELQPWALVGTNHHRRPLAGEDFRIFENAFPRAPERPRIPQEVAAKLGSAWFWSGEPARLDRLPALLERAARAHANLLVDIPPRADGTFPPSLQVMPSPPLG